MGVKAVQWISAENNFILKRHLAKSADIFACHNLGERVQFESAEQMLGLFPSIPSYAGPTPKQETLQPKCQQCQAMKPSGSI